MKKNRSKAKGGGSPAPAEPSATPTPTEPAPAPAPAPQQARGSSARQDRNANSITIQAKVDVGFGNHLYIRGGGPGLSWAEGTPLECVDAETWVWKGNGDSEPFEFKLLINDQNWCIGANYTAQPGAAMQIIPHFC